MERGKQAAMNSVFPSENTVERFSAPCISSWLSLIPSKPLPFPSTNSYDISCDLQAFSFLVATSRSLLTTSCHLSVPRPLLALHLTPISSPHPAVPTLTRFLPYTRGPTHREGGVVAGGVGETGDKEGLGSDVD